MKMLTGVQGTGDAHPVKRRITPKKRLSNRHCPAAASSATPSGWWPKNTMGITTAVRPRPTLIGLRKSGSGEKRVAVHEMASSRSGKSVPRRRYCSHVSRSPCWGKRLATSTICKRASPATQRCCRSASTFRTRLTRDRAMGLFLTLVRLGLYKDVGASAQGDCRAPPGKTGKEYSKAINGYKAVYFQGRAGCSRR